MIHLRLLAQFGRSRISQLVEGLGRCLRDSYSDMHTICVEPIYLWYALTAVRGFRQ